MKRKFLSTLVCLAVILIAVMSLPTQAQAASDSDLTFMLNDDGDSYSVKDCSTSVGGALTIPAIYNGKPVSSIADWAFQMCKSLTSVTIPDSVTYIGSYAFYGCTNLTSLTIPDSVTNIGSDAFYGCNSLRYNTYDNGQYLGNNRNPYVAFLKPTSTSITSCEIHPDTKVIAGGAFRGYSSLINITIPEGVTSIGNYAFRDCSSLTEITIPDSVTSIGNYAFYDCNNLTNVTIPDSVTYIGHNAFYGCSSLTEITIPSNVNVIGDHAFGYCNSLTGIWVAEQNTDYCSDKFGVLFNKKKTELIQAPGGISGCYFIPNSVTNIYSYAFYNCANLTSITIGNSITSIVECTFGNCSSLTSVTIPDSVTNIGSHAFYGCTNLTSLTIPDSVINIGRYAFNGCTNLTSLTIPDSVTSIDDGAFSSCTSLTNITLPDSVTYIGDYTFSGCSSLVYNTYDNGRYLGNSSNPYIALLESKSPGITSCEIHPDTKVIAGAAFFNCRNLTSITIPDNVTFIGDGSFSSCSSLSNITIGDSVTSIDDDAFSSCTSLTNITLPDSVTYIGHNAFSSCSNLTSITIPDSVTYIGDYAFYECFSLTGIIIPDNVISIGNYTFYECFSLTSITIPDSVTSIGNYTFYCCSSMTSVTIGNNVTSIGDYAFDGCSSLTSITIGDSVTSIGIYAFDGCSSLTSITIPDNVAAIGDWAFNWCRSLSSVTIGDGISSIGSNAFYNCISLAYNTYDNGQYLGNNHNPYVAFLKPTSTSVTSCEIHPDTKVMADSAFYNCSSLTSVTIGDRITSIGNYTFRGCSSLTSITIPGSVTSIGNYAFYDCSNLNCITSRDSIKSIGEYAFWYCSSLRDVYYCGTEAQWNSIQIHPGNNPLTDEVMHYHNYSTLVIIEPTLTKAGQEQKTCLLCGNSVITTIDMLVGKVFKWNITLEDDYTVNFYLQVSESIQNTAKVRLTVGNDIVTYNVSDFEKTEDGYFRLTANISAAQMNDFITVMVTNGRDVGCNNTYTARQYCDTILADPQHSRYHTLVKEMLNYGAMAQIYFDYDTEYLANDGITGVANTEIPKTTEEIIISDKISGLNFYGASLVYQNRIAVRYYFTGDIAGCAFTANGNTYTPVTKDGMYYVEVPDILPQNLDHQITLVVADTAGDTLSVSYSPMNYIVRMNAKGNENLQNLLKALYNYHLAAKELNQSAA